MEISKELECALCSDGTAFLLSDYLDLIHQGNLVKVKSYYYKCNTCGEEYTTTQSDDKTMLEFLEKNK